MNLLLTAPFFLTLEMMLKGSGKGVFVPKNENSSQWTSSCNYGSTRNLSPEGKVPCNNQPTVAWIKLNIIVFFFLFFFVGKEIVSGKN